MCVADVHYELQAFPKMVGALHDDVKSLDASGGYISLRGHLGFTAFEIESDQNLKLVVQRTSPLMHGRDAATGTTIARM